MVQSTFITLVVVDLLLLSHSMIFTITNYAGSGSRFVESNAVIATVIPYAVLVPLLMIQVRLTKRINSESGLLRGAVPGMLVLDFSLRGGYRHEAQGLCFQTRYELVGISRKRKESFGKRGDRLFFAKNVFPKLSLIFLSIPTTSYLPGKQSPRASC
jgi:hypothetical protein